jgi:hypothetical protein
MGSISRKANEATPNPTQNTVRCVGTFVVCGYLPFRLASGTIRTFAAPPLYGHPGSRQG